ncbi:MAG: hypothetical protein RLZZ303_1121 [Candidatus Hydrogenedentota bacterium]|jgi:hypothetical protein
MYIFLRSASLALVIAAAIQCFTVGYLSPKLSLEVCSPMVRETRSERLAPAGKLHLINRDGAIQVRTHTEPIILLEADLRAYAATSESATLAGSYLPSLVQVTQQPEGLRVVTEPGERPEAIDVLVNYVVYVPEDTSVSIEGGNGNVFIGAGCGPVSVQSNNADVEITDPHGTVEAKVANGRIRVTGAVEPVAIETVNGSIYAYLNGGALRASTANGNIYAHLLDPEITACDLTAMNGGITLALAEDCSAEVNATTGGGTVRSDLLVQQIRGVRKRQALHGTIGDGQTRLTMNSLNGDILITRSDT